MAEMVVEEAAELSGLRVFRSFDAAGITRFAIQWWVP